MVSGAARLSQQLLDTTAAATPDGQIATVTAVAATGGTDGQPLVTVRHNGAVLSYPHFSSYSPAVGDVVALGRWGGTWVILGRPVGFPTGS